MISVQDYDDALAVATDGPNDAEMPHLFKEVVVITLNIKTAANDLRLVRNLLVKARAHDDKCGLGHAMAEGYRDAAQMVLDRLLGLPQNSLHSQGFAAKR